MPSLKEHVEQIANVEELEITENQTRQLFNTLKIKFLLFLLLTQVLKTDSYEKSISYIYKLYEMIY